MVHSALCTRVLLNLRRAAARASGLDLGTFNAQRTTLMFDPVPAEANGAEGRGDGLEAIGYYE